MSEQPMMLVDVNRLEHFVPSSDRGIRDVVKIDGVQFRQLTPAVYAVIHRRVKKLEAAHQEGRVAGEVWEAVRSAWETIYAWALDRYGEEALRSAYEAELAKVA